MEISLVNTGIIRYFNPSFYCNLGDTGKLSDMKIKGQ